MSQTLIYVALGVFALVTLSIAVDIETRMQVASVHVNIPPTEAEARYYALIGEPAMAA